MEINQCNKAVRMPAEWEPQDAVMIAWPHVGTDWEYMLGDIRHCYMDIVNAISASGEQLIIVCPESEELPQEVLSCENVRVIGIDTNDTWTRDYGAISTIKDGVHTVVDFKFNGWGLKFAANKDNLVTMHMAEQALFSAERDNSLSFVLEGGSIESDGAGTILTTSECLLSPNRNGSLSREQIEEVLCDKLGATRVLWLEHGYLAGDDTDSHVDTLARLVDADKIAYVKCYRKDDEHYAELQAMEQELMNFKTVQGESYKLFPLPLPEPIYDEEGLRLPATYANFLIMNNRVLVPTYAQPQNDEEAMGIIARIFPGREIIGIDSRALIRQHGSIHCATMQFPKGFIK